MADEKPKYDVETVEALAQVICGLCSEKKLRWKDRQYGDFTHQDEPHDTEGTECEANAVLQAALKLGIPIDTGAAGGDRGGRVAASICPAVPNRNQGSIRYLAARR